MSAAPLRNGRSALAALFLSGAGSVALVVPQIAAGRLARARAGIGHRWSWRSLLWRLASG